MLHGALFTPIYDYRRNTCIGCQYIGKLGRISTVHALETKPHLRRNNRIKSIHSSLRIEANSLSLGQVRDVLNGRLVLGEQREIQEVKNAYAAYEKLPEIDPFDLEELKKLHGIMTQFLEEESGMFRTGEEGVFRGDRCIFVAPPAMRVPDLMEDLLSWMTRSRKTLHPLILSAVFHYEFVFIHPFADGNGRMARLWHTAILSKWKPILPISRWKARLSGFRMTTMKPSLPVIKKAHPIPLWNLCSIRSIRFWMS